MLIAILFGFSLLLTSCSDGTPSRERFPGPQGATTDSDRANTQKAVLGGFDPLNTQLAGSKQNNSAKKENAKRLLVQIQLHQSVKLKPGMLLYVAARRPEGGAPVAVQRITASQIEFPATITLSEQNSMLRDGSPFEGQVIVSARLDQDGDPLSKQKGDAGALSAEVSIQNQKISLTLKPE